MGGGFLAGAMQTAVGVAGGMLVADALSHAFSAGTAGVSELAQDAGWGAASSEPAPDRFEEGLLIDRLGEELDGPGLHCPHGHGDVALASQEDDRDLEVGVLQLLLEIEPRHVREPHVKDQATWAVWPFVAQERLRRSERLRTQANRLQHALDGGAH